MQSQTQCHIKVIMTCRWTGKIFSCCITLLERFCALFTVAWVMVYHHDWAAPVMVGRSQLSGGTRREFLHSWSPFFQWHFYLYLHQGPLHTNLCSCCRWSKAWGWCCYAVNCSFSFEYCQPERSMCEMNKMKGTLEVNVPEAVKHLLRC